MHSRSPLLFTIILSAAFSFAITIPGANADCSGLFKRVGTAEPIWNDFINRVRKGPGQRLERHFEETFDEFTLKMRAKEKWDLAINVISLYQDAMEYQNQTFEADRKAMLEFFGSKVAHFKESIFEKIEADKENTSWPGVFRLWLHEYGQDPKRDRALGEMFHFLMQNSKLGFLFKRAVELEIKELDAKDPRRPAVEELLHLWPGRFRFEVLNFYKLYLPENSFAEDGIDIRDNILGSLDHELSRIGRSKGFKNYPRKWVNAQIETHLFELKESLSSQELLFFLAEGIGAFSIINDPKDYFYHYFPTSWYWFRSEPGAFAQLTTEIQIAMARRLVDMNSETAWALLASVLHRDGGELSRWIEGRFTDLKIGTPEAKIAGLKKAFKVGLPTVLPKIPQVDKKIVQAYHRRLLQIAILMKQQIIDEKN